MTQEACLNRVYDSASQEHAKSDTEPKSVPMLLCSAMLEKWQTMITESKSDLSDLPCKGRRVWVFDSRIKESKGCRRPILTRLYTWSVSSFAPLGASLQSISCFSQGHTIIWTLQYNIPTMGSILISEISRLIAGFKSDISWRSRRCSQRFGTFRASATVHGPSKQFKPEGTIENSNMKSVISSDMATYVSSLTTSHCVER